jgi:hypothetical protein
LKEQIETRKVKEIVKTQEETMQAIGRYMAETKEQMTEELAARNYRDERDKWTRTVTRRHHAIDAFPKPNTARISGHTASLNPMDTLYWTIDVSRTEEGEDGRSSAGAIRSMVESGIRSELDNPT